MPAISFLLGQTPRLRLSIFEVHLRFLPSPPFRSQSQNSTSDANSVAFIPRREPKAASEASLHPDRAQTASSRLTFNLIVSLEEGRRRRAKPREGASRRFLSSKALRRDTRDLRSRLETSDRLSCGFYLYSYELAFYTSCFSLALKSPTAAHFNCQTSVKTRSVESAQTL